MPFGVVVWWCMVWLKGSLRFPYVPSLHANVRKDDRGIAALYLPPAASSVYLYRCLPADIHQLHLHVKLNLISCTPHNGIPIPTHQYTQKDNHRRRLDKPRQIAHCEFLRRGSKELHRGMCGLAAVQTGCSSGSRIRSDW